MELTEAEDMKMVQEYTEELYKKVLMTQLTTMWQSLTQSHTSSFEMKWALGSITKHKAREVTEFQLSYFKS